MKTSVEQQKSDPTVRSRHLTLKSKRQRWLSSKASFDKFAKIREQLRVSISEAELTLQNLQKSKEVWLKKKGDELKALVVSQKAQLEELEKALRNPTSESATLDGGASTSSSGLIRLSTLPVLAHSDKGHSSVRRTVSNS